RMARRRGPPLLHRDAAARGRLGAADPARDGEVPAPSVARRHANDARGGRGARVVADPGRADRMTSFERFENRLPAMLDELAVPRLPDYADDLFARTAATRQRAGWTFPERWLPMSAISRRFAAVPPVPWRLGVAVALLIVAGIVALIVAGSRTTRVAPPFGPASNGVIPYMSHGKLYVGDLASGKTQLIVDAAGDQGQPVFS